MQKIFLASSIQLKVLKVTATMVWRSLTAVQLILRNSWGNPKVIHWSGTITLWEHYRSSSQVESIILWVVSLCEAGHRSSTELCVSVSSSLLLAVSHRDVTAVAGESRILCCWHHGKITSPSFCPTGELPSQSFLKALVIPADKHSSIAPSLPSSFYKAPDPTDLLRKLCLYCSFHGMILLSQRSKISVNKTKTTKMIHQFSCNKSYVLQFPALLSTSIMVPLIYT